MEKTFLIIAIVIVLFGSAVLAIDPAFADILYDEGRLFENLTVLICATALIFSLTHFLKNHKAEKPYGFWLFLSIFLFLFIGDEISWGLPLFGVTEPLKIAGINFDGLHDFVSIGISTVKLTRDYVISIGLLDPRSISIIAGSAAIAIASVFYLIKLFTRNKESIHRFFSVNLKWKPFLFFLIGLILLLIAIYIDDDNLVSFPHKGVVEESLEIIASIAFLFAPLSSIKDTKICMT